MVRLVLAAWSTDLEDGSGRQAEERGAPRIGSNTATRRGKAQRALCFLSMVFRGGGDCGDLAVSCRSWQRVYPDAIFSTEQNCAILVRKLRSISCGAG